jgi:hypothetical protein
MQEVANDKSNPYRNMFRDELRMNEGNVSQCPIIEEEPNADAARFITHTPLPLEMIDQELIGYPF